MEENWKRLLKWDPNLVIVNQLADTFMVDPEHPCVKLTAPLRLRLIANRNLCKRVLSKFCTVDGAHS